MPFCTLGDPVCASINDIGLRLSVGALFSDGDPRFAPLAVAWVLHVSVSVNNEFAGVTIVENLLASFLRGTFARESGPIVTEYHQIHAGFQVTFTPGLVDQNASHKRVYLKHVYLELEFVHQPMPPHEAYPSYVALADYLGGCGLAGVARMAPAVFGNGYSKIQLELPHLWVLKKALGLENTQEAECELERRHLQESDCGLGSLGGLFDPGEYNEPQVRLLEKGEGVHEYVSLEQILEARQV